MTTLDLQIIASVDDAHEKDDDTTFSSTTSPVQAYSSTSSTSRWNTGLRFANVTVPNGATINVCYIEVFITPIGDDPNVTIYCEAVDNAANFSTTADVTSRANSTASVSWVATNLGWNAFKTSPSLVGPVQEIVNRGGWASGNAIVFLFRGKTDFTSEMTIQSYDGSSTNAAKLHIEYTAAAAGIPAKQTLVGNQSIVRSTVW